MKALFLLSQWHERKKMHQAPSACEQTKKFKQNIPQTARNIYVLPQTLDVFIDNNEKYEVKCKSS